MYFAKTFSLGVPVDTTPTNDEESGVLAISTNNPLTNEE